MLGPTGRLRRSQPSRLAPPVPAQPAGSTIHKPNRPAAPVLAHNENALISKTTNPIFILFGSGPPFSWVRNNICLVKFSLRCSGGPELAHGELLGPVADHREVGAQRDLAYVTCHKILHIWTKPQSWGSLRLAVYKEQTDRQTHTHTESAKYR